MKRSLQLALSAIAAVSSLLTHSRTGHSEPPMMKEHSVQPHIAATSEDGRYSVSIGGFIQGRYTLAFEDTSFMASRFDTPRTRLYVFGHVHSKNARYRLMLGTPPSALSVELYDAYIDYRFAGALHLRVGHFKIPVYREWIESASLLSSVERSVLTQTVLPGRDWGGMLAGELFSSHVDYAISIFNSGAKLDTEGPLMAGRLAWNVLGRSIEGEIDFDNSPRSVVIGASGYTSFENPERRHMGGGVEVAYRERGLDITVEVMARERWHDQKRSFSGGLYARADKYLPSLKTSFGGRATRVVGLDELITRTELDIGATYFPAEHDLKVAANLGIGRRHDENVWEPFFMTQVQAGF